MYSILIAPMFKKCIIASYWELTRMFRGGPGAYLNPLALIPSLLMIINLEATRCFVRDYERRQDCPGRHQSVSLSMIISPDTPEGGEEALQKYSIFLFLIEAPPHV